jgi:hypothetical protein
MASLTDFGFPFNSVTSDRTYNADVWRDYFKNLFTNGVVPNKLNELAVTESDTPAKSVKVGTGFVIIQGVQYGIETAQTLAITDNASGDGRIDRVVARLDYTNRTAELDILQGTPSATPSAPALTQNATTYEISLAQVYVSNGFTTILNANITDERYDNDVCGIATTIGKELFEQENNFSLYDKEVVMVDGNNMPTEVNYKREDSTLAVKQTASNPDINGYYQTIVERFYEDNGVDVYKTITYSLTYLSNGIINTSSKVVSY